MAKNVTRKCPQCWQTKSYRSDQITCGCKKPKAAKETKTPEQQIDVDLQKLQEKREGKSKKISILERKVLELQKERDALLDLPAPDPIVLEVPQKVSTGSESAAVAIYSDFHSEEEVIPGAVNGKNEHNLEIGEKRFQNLLHGTLAWFHIGSQKTQIKTLVLGLLGDFISGNIHADVAESCLLPPMDAICLVQDRLVGGILFLLEQLPKDVEIVLVCTPGNHSRTTKEQRIATERGHSLEHFLYHNIRKFFADNSRVRVVVAEGYHTYFTFFDKYVVRFHHGHQIRYEGGIGGITIPVRKAIAQWNIARFANLDVFGHFHQRFDGGNFIVNGSLIGYNAYSISIKAAFERPSQQFFLINKEYSDKTLVAPIFCD